MMSNRANTTVCITGATSGIGRALAVKFAEVGFSLILTGRREEQLRAVADSLHVTTELFVGDLREPEICHALAARIRQCTTLHGFVHNAGYGLQEPFVSASSDDLRRMGELHVQCTAELVQAAMDQIKPGGLIMLVSSLASFLPAPGPAMYTATKTFQTALGKALQPELIRRNIRLMVLCPGFTHTDFHDRLGWSAERRANRGLVRWMHADIVALRAFRKIMRQSVWADPVYVPGFSNKVLRALSVILPRRVYLYLVRSFAF
jgi:short-subunit dehydrogenase